MRISDHLKKAYWTRIITDDSDVPVLPSPNIYYFPSSPQQGNLRVQHLTQDDFDKERIPSAHDINSKYQSTRPIWEQQTETDHEGNIVLNPDGSPKKTWKIKDFDKLETVRFGLQERAARTKAAHFAGNGLWVAAEDKDDARYQKFCSYKDSCGIDDAWMELVLSCFQTGDGAIYLYQEGEDIHYHVFSHLKGDMLFPGYDDQRNPILYRLYTLRGQQAVDIYACGYIETWISGGQDESKLQSWWNTFSGWFAKGLKFDSTVKSEDGWVRIARKDTQISNDLNQCIYWRIDDVVWGSVQMDIEGLEKTASCVAEGVKNTTFSKLLLKAMDIVSLPPDGVAGATIGIKGDADTLKASDAKFLPPPDMSNVAEVDFKQKRESIRLSMMDVDITPDILRAGADSSTSVKLMFTPLIQWCMTEWVYFAPQVRYMISVLKALIAKIEGDGEFTKLRLSVGIDVWMPSNDKEVIDNECAMVYAGIKSTKAAAADIGNQWVDDIQNVRQEKIQKIYDEEYTKLKAQAQARKDFGLEDTANDTIVSKTTKEVNPNIPKVDNRAERKDLIDNAYNR